MHCVDRCFYNDFRADRALFSHIRCYKQNYMWTYQISGKAFQCNTRIPELEPVSTDRTDFCVQLYDDHAVQFPPAAQWFNHWYTPDGAIWLSFAKVAAGYLLQFTDLVDFVVAADGSMVSCYPQADVPPQTIYHLLLNQVLPVVLSHRGHMVLHAAASILPQGAAAFMGVGGMGKSTLSASLGLQGYPIITDDCLLIEERAGGIVGLPSYAGSRLWQESVAALCMDGSALRPVAHYTDKQRLLLTQAQLGEPVALRAVYVLAEPAGAPQTADVNIAPMGTHGAFLECIQHAFQLDITDQARLGHTFRRVEQLVKAVPFFWLIYPRDFALLPRLHQAILEHLDQIVCTDPEDSRPLMPA